MTIFLKVLKKLIKEQLSPLSIGLGKKAKSVGYNADLSTDQKVIVDKLEEEILRFEGSDDDEADAIKIGDLVDKAREKIQSVREKYGQARDEGETITCLNNLKLHTNDFHKKLTSFKLFNLLNKQYSETPENVIYYHAVYYFGEEIFVPKSNMDGEIRKEKESKLEKRLQSLSELIKPTYSLEEQRERSLQVLNDLASDNKLAIKKDEGHPLAIPGLSFWGFQVTAPTEWFAASEGRMGVQFNLAARTIREMTTETFEPPVVPEVGAVNEM